MGCRITAESIEGFRAWLVAEEKSQGTIGKYLRDVQRLGAWLGQREVSREGLAEWKQQLMEGGYAAVTVNSMLGAVNTYCRYAGLSFRVRFLRVQRRLFREESRELTKEEYERLIGAAGARGNDRLALLIETIGGTGIRVSELRYITVEAARCGRAQVALKGKIREILLPTSLRRKLLRYARRLGIGSGEIFITRNGTGMSRKQVWTEMKALCLEAGVEADKVFPHNLRHLFARVYYGVTHDVSQLADLLGHSSIETTRIYLISTGAEHAEMLERMGMVGWCGV